MTSQNITMIFGFALALGTSSILEACRDDENGSGAARKTASCETVCAKYELCYSEETDESECVEDCIMDRGWSNDAFAEMAQCADEASCDELEGDDEDWGECLYIALADIQPGRVAEQFCKELASTLETCDDAFDESEGRRSCEDYARWFSNEYIEAQGDCLKESCDSMHDCFDDIADRFRTEAELEDVIPAMNECCADDDPCGWADDGYCDCNGTAAWDSMDC
jgi:hypothetical protein